jgi:hypothetical protein
MILEIHGGLGDEVAATAAVREYKRQNPDEIVTIFQPSGSITPTWVGGSMKAGAALRYAWTKGAAITAATPHTRTPRS